MRDAPRRRRHHDELGREEQRLLDAVRDEEEHLLRLPPQLQDQLLDLLARQRVECAERLVHQHHLGIARERASEADPLLHAARKLVDRMIGELLEADEAQLVERDAAALVFWRAAHPQAERDVLGDVEPGHQRVLLEHDAALGAGPVTGLPSRTISPAEYCMNPAMQDKSVVLPQPERPARRRSRRDRAPG
jgi:hypothetical protein